MKFSKSIITSKGNEIEFYRTDEQSDDVIVVRDDTCQLERTYRVGNVQELDDFEEVEIKSVDQVIESWSNEKIWF